MLEKNIRYNLETKCLGNGYNEENITPCNESVSIPWEEIYYEEWKNDDGSVRKEYSFYCPKCHAKTIIDKKSLPVIVQNVIMDNNGFEFEGFHKCFMILRKLK